MTNRGTGLTFQEADRLHRDVSRTEREALRALEREARANARYKDHPGRLSYLRLSLAMKAAVKAEDAQSRAAIAHEAAVAAHPEAFEPNGEAFPQVEELNPPETPGRRRFHRGLYAVLIPLLRAVIRLTYGGHAVYEGAGSETVGSDDAAGDSTPVAALPAPRETDAPIRAKADPASRTGAIVVINHTCYLDSVMAAVALWPTRLRFLSLASNGYGHVWGPVVRALGTIFVGHTMAETREMLQRMGEALAAGDDLAIYPEGNLRPYEDELQPFERGAFQIAVAAKAPIVPVVLVQAPGRGFIKRLLGKPGFEVHVGEPIPCPTGLRPRKAAVRLEAEVRSAMEAILERGPVRETVRERLAARIFPA